MYHYSSCGAVVTINMGLLKLTPIMYMYFSGLLEPVIDLKALVNDSTNVLLIWTPPYTLKGVPIKHYSVTITNTISGEKETVNTAQPFFFYNSLPGVNYNATVIAVNKVGSSKPAAAVSFITPAS